MNRMKRKPENAVILAPLSPSPDLVEPFIGRIEPGTTPQIFFSEIWPGAMDVLVYHPFTPGYAPSLMP